MTIKVVEIMEIESVERRRLGLYFIHTCRILKCNLKTCYDVR